MESNARRWIFGALALALAMTVAPGRATQEPEGALGPPLRIGEVEFGSLLLQTVYRGVYLPAPIVHTDVEIRVTGIVARTRVSQWFVNPTEHWVEGVYVFPLPERAAVDGLRMVVGDRTIEGRIEEREEAKRVYEAAKREGKKASLLEQERPNVFTTSVANLGPGEEVEVVLEYQEELSFADGRFSLRFPMVVAPRYAPGGVEEGIPGGPSGPGGASLAAFSGSYANDARRISPPVPHPVAGPRNPVSLRVELDTGFRLAHVASLAHPVEVRRRSGGAGVELARDAVPADRDFVLEWSPASGRLPRAAAFTEEIDGEHYVLLLVAPPDSDRDPVHLTREVVLVVDTSGSMGGASIRQARAALVDALKRMRPGDRFNVIRFDSTTERLFDQSVPVEPWAIEEAIAWVERLEAGGGTEMYAALAAALEDPDPHGRDLRQVVFVTDGAVADEDRLFGLIHQLLGRSRLFPVGIGSAPSSHFMRRAAEAGRGTFTYIGSVEEVEAVMGDLLRKLGSPALRDLDVDFGPGEVEAWPQSPPDLYLGEPLVLAARLRQVPEEVTLRGFLGDQAWELVLEVPEPVADSGVGKLWARRKISDLMAGLHTGADPEAVRQAVLEVALGHHLVSRYTSLVAVDVTPTAPIGELPETRRLPIDLPAGWEAELVGVSLPAGGTGARLEVVAGILLFVVGLFAWRWGRP